MKTSRYIDIGPSIYINAIIMSIRQLVKEIEITHIPLVRYLWYQ